MQNDPRKRPSAAIITLGCKVNQYESEAIAEELERRGFSTDAAGAADVYIINTCTVTAESDRKSRQAIRRAMKENPDSFVIVTGCSAQYDADKIAKIQGVDAIVGNREKMKAVDAAISLLHQGKKNTSPAIDVPDLDGADFEKTAITKFDRTRAYIKIEDGCESRCAYCTIPAVRGSIRSKAPEDVISEVQNFISDGCGEIVLTGIETGSYGKDLGGITLAELMERIDALDGIGRVRTGSLDPSVITEDFARRVSRLTCAAPHYHLSLQSGCSKTLARMRRKYNADMAYRALERLRAHIPDVCFTTDVIVGFPGESEEDFEETVHFARRARFLKIHVFPYSPRNGTEAAQMDGQVPEDVKKQRVHRLSALETQIRAELLSDYVRTHECAEVLFETFRGGVAYGHTPSFIEVAVDSPVSLSGQLRRVRLLSSDGERIYGKIEK
ncbi:MAG: tRNA (N(6)-L-threonylcarbamoyladenosine(37)-C(2))-methylthiotransferase MtaB [Ruminococcaceae bacterium]|nr:tRNA (N(6)-L-threonylcarbamoyladenosine(37)-C(2))-methylthiotransferase MtaB [Oscillospiraceae bacterium]